MPLNPLRFAAAVNQQYLRYQLTSNRIADPVLQTQLEKQLWPRGGPLLKGPYVSLNRAFQEGATTDQLIEQGLLHPAIRGLIPHPHVYKHQEEALRELRAGHNLLVTTGTGSGKTEAFLYPIISHCLELKNKAESKPGVTALIVYPMNALANDQLERLRELLVGTGVTFGLYTGDTSTDDAGQAFEVVKLPPGANRKRFQELREKRRNENVIISPPEERRTRQDIQADPPRILLTNKQILEYILTRPEDLPILRNAPLEYLVIDEAHTYSGADGAEASLLFRRLKTVTKPPNNKIQCVATSATITDQKHDPEGRRFLNRLMGCAEENVRIIRESYKGITWPGKRHLPTFPAKHENILDQTLDALNQAGQPAFEKKMESLFVDLTGFPLPAAPSIPQRVHKALLENEFAYAIYAAGSSTKPLLEQVRLAWEESHRGNPETDAHLEYLAYLALGAFAEHEGTPLYRPKLHFFVKGLEGVVAVLKVGGPDRPVDPVLHLTAEDAQKKWHGQRDPTAIFPILVCPRCGQHHYQAYVQDVASEDYEPLQGGHQLGDGASMFPPDATQTQNMVLFTDWTLKDLDDDNTRYIDARACYGCGAIHLGSPSKCGHCDRPNTLLDIQVLNSTRRTKSCPICSYTKGFGTQFSDHPFQALREVTVRNIYVLAQDMLNQADAASKKLLIFADNRQDAAFQAGWMRDRARRYRFRQLMHATLRAQYDKAQKPVSLEDLVTALQATLEADRSLAQLVAPEVFEEALDSPWDDKLRQLLRAFLTIQVLRENTSSYNARESLEAWGKVRHHYFGLAKDHPGVVQIAKQFQIDPANLTLWLECLLDSFRKRQQFHHSKYPIFARSWNDLRFDLVQNRLLPETEFRPSGLRLERLDGDPKSTYAKVWLSPNTAVQDWCRVYDFEKEQREEFLRKVWDLLVEDLKLLVRLDCLYHGGGGRIQGTDNVYQVAALKVALTPSDERFQCAFCARPYAHATPHTACTRHRCKTGKVQPLADREPRDYDLVLLENASTFVMAAEHTAQVPRDQRLRIEQSFKSGAGINTLVSSPTLELGVDIGSLDVVLMRNVPPLPANYWQRAGRGGRRNRMAIIYTYCRNTNHDQHYYKSPESLLGGAIRPPQVNLKNPIMVQKHAHSAIITQLLAEGDETVTAAVQSAIPKLVGQALFKEGRPRTDASEVAKPLETLLSDPARRARIIEGLQVAFTRQWPEHPELVTKERLETITGEMPRRIRSAYERILRRLEWAWKQRIRLARLEAEGHTLSEEERRFKERCDGTVRSMNPATWNDEERRINTRKTYTLRVLAQEGFLPGYATGQDSVVATADRAFLQGWSRFEFDLPRPSPIALWEHIPGNRIYANGGKYQVSYYKFPASQEVRNPTTWIIKPATKSVTRQEDLAAAYHDPTQIELPSLPLVDTSLRFIRHVEDLETTRFRLASVDAGILLPQHEGGQLFQDSGRRLELRRGQHVTLLNLGAKMKVDKGEYGYPLCRICGGLRSPIEGDAAIEKFEEHHEKSCGEKPKRYALHVRTVVDGLLIPGLMNKTEAVSLGETLILAGASRLDMERDDLGWIVMPQGDDSWDLFLYDPMPGGSGLLSQVLQEWSATTQTGKELLLGCSGACSVSCYDCLRTYRNQAHHDELSRSVALALLERLGKTLPEGTRIEPQQEAAQQDGEASNTWEKRLENMVLSEWGFHGFTSQFEVELPHVASRTIPDLAHPAARIAIYLDGPVHDEEKTKLRDRFLRNELQGLDPRWEVVELRIQDFENDRFMKSIQTRISRILERNSNE